MTGEKPKVVVITGPTASGKSSLAVDLALHFGAEIVNADSMQVYRGMDVGTAKPTTAERRRLLVRSVERRTEPITNVSHTAPP